MQGIGGIDLHGGPFVGPLEIGVHNQGIGFSYCDAQIKVTPVIFDAGIVFFFIVHIEPKFGGEFYARTFLFIIKKKNGFDVGIIGAPGKRAAPAIGFVQIAGFNEQAVQGRRRGLYTRRDKVKFRHITGVFKWCGIRIEIPKGCLGIAQVKSLHPWVAFGQWLIRIKEAILKTNLEFAIFRIGAHQKVHGFVKRDIFHIGLVQCHEGIHGGV